MDNTTEVLSERSSTSQVDKTNDILDLRRNSSPEYSTTKDSNLNITEGENTSSGDDQAPMILKKRVRKFSASDSDLDENVKITHGKSNKIIDSSFDIQTGTNDDSGVKNLKSLQRRRVQQASTDSDTSDTVAIKNVEQQKRVKNKRHKMRDKFRSLLTSRVTDKPQIDVHTEVTEDRNKESPYNSDEEISSIEKIKQKIKERISFKPSICDPDTSDEESSHQKPIYRQKKGKKSTQPTSPKPLRMTAKQAMENMQKIKSESNRMLREQEVSLPYHRPKALTLKDIMKRRRPAVTSDGKALPIKMNEEQLKHYVSLLEQRQKEMIELCKSDTEDEENDGNTFENQDISRQSDENKKIQQETFSCSSQCDNTTVIKPADETKQIENYIEQNKLVNCDQYVQIPEVPVTKSNINNNYVSGSDTVLRPAGSADNVKSNIEDEIINDKIHSDTSISIDESTEKQFLKTVTEPDSQLISLHFDTVKHNTCIDQELQHKSTIKHNLVEVEEGNSENNDHRFSDDDINMEDIDAIIENADIIKNINNEQCINSPLLIRDQPSNINPKLTGAPGMIIDLDGRDPFAPKKLSGVELLKERFTFFAKLKRPEDMERDRESKLKPGRLHIKLKQELEELIAEKRSLEWTKRLDDEIKQQTELKALRGDGSDSGDEIEKIEAKLEENNDDIVQENSSESDEEEEEDICNIKEKPRTRNTLVVDEAEESDCDEFENEDGHDVDENINEKSDGDVGNDSESDDDSSEQESSESGDERQSNIKKSRILKAFEDSDDDDATNKEIKLGFLAKNTNNINDNSDMTLESQAVSQDDDLQLAQRHKSVSEDLFTSQESGLIVSSITIKSIENQHQPLDDKELGTQTFSILDSTVSKGDNIEIKLNCSDKLSIVCETQPYYDDNLNAVAAMCSGSFSQNLAPSQLPPTQMSQSQAIGEDILALCTGKFYDNQFISQVDENVEDIVTPTSSPQYDNCNHNESGEETTNLRSINSNIEKNDSNKLETEDGHILKSILDELHDSQFDSPKPNKFFCGDKTAQRKENNQNVENSVLKKRLIIESEDETNEVDEKTDQQKTKKLKKKKPEKRALQISDYEESEESDQDEIEDMSDVEAEVEDNARIVEYDSEENEVVVQPQNTKKKRKMADFFEQEAELTSEDEWVGSGDEDEAGLDRMEREAGDDDTFNQGKLQRELGQIHMRDVLDQDKREVRLIQELMFEDGDLGDGHRQRKFRWRNTDREDEPGTVVDEFGDTQEEEFESEEQWRKQRHEREVFLRQMQTKDDQEEDLNVSVNRPMIIKANLCSKSMSSLLLEVNTSNTENVVPVEIEKKTARDIPSPKKSFTILQQNYHGSLLTRGQGALARLAALATPLAVDDDAPKFGSVAPTSRRNFVFAALTPKEDKPKMAKRKIESNEDTPKLVKKMKTEDKQTFAKNSLLHHIKL